MQTTQDTVGVSQKKTRGKEGLRVHEEAEHWACLSSVVEISVEIFLPRGLGEAQALHVPGVPQQAAQPLQCTGRVVW